MRIGFAAALHESPSKAAGFRPNRAFSLTELLTVIAVIGILSGIAILSYQGVNAAAKETVATDNMQLLNRAVLHYSQAVQAISTAAASGSADELAVISLLKTRNAAIPGSPYLSGTFSDTVSASTEDYRLQWNGYAFELLPPGADGTGIKAM